MRSLLILICLLGISFAAFSQKSVISSDKMNVLYIGVPNPVTIMAEGYTCAQTSVEAEGCTFTLRDGCSYDALVTRPGTVLAKVKAGGKVVGEHQFRIKYIPDPVARIGGKLGGRMPAAVFKAQLGLVASLESFDFDARFNMVSFHIAVTRNGAVLFDEDNKGGAFNEAAKKFIQTMRPGDIVMFSDIKAVGPDSRARLLPPLEIELV